MSRGGFKINKNKNDFEFDSGDQNLPSWLKSYADQMSNNKTAVEVARDRGDSFFDQITNIISGKSRFATVESVVEDMQKRTGLAEYLNKLQASADKMKQERLRAAAQIITENQSVNIPDVVKKNSDIKNFIEDRITSKHGKISKHAIQLDLESFFSNSPNVDKKELADPALLDYIQSRIDNISKMYPSTDDYSSMGKSTANESQDKDDSLNNDAFHWAEPSK